MSSTKPPKVSKPKRAKGTALVGQPTAGHDPTFDPTCEVCQSPKRRLLEDLYGEHTMNELAIALELELRRDGQPDTRQVGRHMRAVGAEQRKYENWQGFYRQIKAKGLEALASGEVSPDTMAKLAVQAAQQEDRIEGRVKTGVNIQDNRQITLLQPPMPGGVSGLEGEAEQKDLPEQVETVTIEADFGAVVPGKT